MPSVHTDTICPPLLVPAGGTIAWIDGCDGDTFVLDGTRWDPVPPAGALEGPVSYVAHLDGHPVAIEWLAPGPERRWTELVPG